MSEAPTLIYLEADDEITTVVRRLRAADPGRVVIVAPGRSRATSSVVALRLLARAGEEEGRELVIVGDGLTRSLAAEAGLAAFSSVGDAHSAPDGTAAEAPAPHHAAIHVVRGPASDDTAPTLAAAPPAADGTETRPVPVSRAPRRDPRRRATGRPRRSGRIGPLVPLLLAAAALIAGGAFVGATVLPAATIRIAARTEAIGPVPYEIAIENPERVSGTVEADAAVTATGTYAIQEPAFGSVIFRNFNVVPIDVPAGTRVAAGEVVFVTTAAAVAPAGSLTGAGTIAGGEVAADVVAEMIGDAGNVAAEAIDTVLDQPTRNRLRGFPQNSARLVINPEPTAGGVDSTGTEFTQDDVDAAVEALRADLRARLADELAGTEGGLFADPSEPAEATIDIPEDLAGTRDEEQATISGELAYDRLMADRAEVTALARERFASDPEVVPEDHQLLADAIEVGIGNVRRDGDTLIVSVTVSGQSLAAIDRGEVIRQAVGRSEAEAEAALAELGDATVELWPGWVTTVPDSDWRIDIQEVSGGARPDPSGP